MATAMATGHGHGQGVAPSLPSTPPTPLTASPQVTQYSGECMAPFSAGDISLPYVSEMLKYTLPNV